jgi:alkylated DNA repair dioxygenase AlkB
MKQAELFTDAPEKRAVEVSIPGFKLLNNYVSEGEERELLARVDQNQWQSDFRRRTQQYGLGYSSEHGQKPVWLRDFPHWLMPLAMRVGVDAEFERFPENCVINEYIPPLGIGPHRDYPAFGPTVACVSLGSDIVMDFTEPEDKLRVAIHVPARSFWVITGAARYKWRHGIASRLTDVIDGERRPRSRRVSITFRTAR